MTYWKRTRQSLNEQGLSGEGFLKMLKHNYELEQETIKAQKKLKAKKKKKKKAIKA